jgi:hypothetical protein
MSGIGAFLGRLGGKIASGLGKLPGLIGKGVGIARGLVSPAVRKVGEVAGSISRGIGSEAPEWARKIGSFAGKVYQKAPGIADIIEKGANIASGVSEALGGRKITTPMEQTQPEIETVGAEEAGSARKGYNKHFGGGANMGYSKMSNVH